MENHDKVKFIERISKLRNDNNLSARKLSNLIGKNYGYINKLECDKDFLPTIDTLFDILEVCNTTPAEFFYYDPSQYKNDIMHIKGGEVYGKKSPRYLLYLWKRK